MSKVLISSIAALGLSAAAASAATISYTDSFGPSLTEFVSSSNVDVNPFDIPVNAAALSFNLFDGSLGTLNSVQVTLSGGFDSAGKITNKASGTELARVSETLSLFFSSALFGLQTLNAEANTGFVSYASGAIGTAVNLTGSQSASIAPDIAGFTGVAGETFFIDFGTLLSTTVVGGGGNLDFFVKSTGSVSATVVYDYDAVVPAPVPLPAGGVLLVSALLGLGFSRRKKA